MKNKKIIVAHPMQQHSYKLAGVLKKNGILCKYCTTIYNKKNSVWFKLLKQFLSERNVKRAKNRRTDSLNDSDVVQFYLFYGFISRILVRIPYLSGVYHWWQQRLFNKFGEAVAKYAIKYKVDAVVMYDTTADKCFEILKEKAPNIKRILDMSAANPIYMKTIYENDMVVCPAFAKKLISEIGHMCKRKALINSKREITNTQFFLVASQFVQDSLYHSGINEHQIFKCPYGSNFLTENKKPTCFAIHSPLEVVYVGNVSEMKGIYYLLEAVMTFPLEKIHLTVVGNFNNNGGVFTHYMEHITFTGRVLHSEVYDYLRKADLFIFPSLGDGMGLAVLEAMGMGIPSIMTVNTGVSDFIRDGINGFVVPIQNVKVLVDKIQWCIENPIELLKMQDDVLKTAKKLTWREYEKRVVDSIEMILNKE